MDIENRIVVVTGAAGGIGKALAIRFHQAGAKTVVCADLDKDGAEATAAEINGVAHQINVASEDEIKNLIDTVESEQGPIDLFCSNAGIMVKGGPEAANDDWQKIWDINVMAHVYAARHDRTGPRLFSEHRLRRRAAVTGGFRTLLGHQACRRGTGRMAGLYLC